MLDGAVCNYSYENLVAVCPADVTGGHCAITIVMVLNNKNKNKYKALKKFSLNFVLRS